jgi:hypothetical protein
VGGDDAERAAGYVIRIQRAVSRRSCKSARVSAELRELAARAAGKCPVRVTVEGESKVGGVRVGKDGTVCDDGRAEIWHGWE